MGRLFTNHLPALQVAFSDAKRIALEQPVLLSGTAGSVTTRIVNGRSFLYRQYYDATGRKAADYIGAVDDPAASARANTVRERIEVANELLATARMLARSGYVRVDARTDAIVAAIANNGLFRAGGMVVGSHAYGALVNDLGARTAGYATEDIDVARDRVLDLSAVTERKSFAAVLADSGIPLLPVPQLDRKKPSTSYKPAGADRLRIDLLVPTGGEEVKVLEVRELAAHATALPHLRYVLEEPIDTVILGRSSVVPVKVPRPERLAWHKMLVSELRGAANDKKAKDREQAAVLFAILTEQEPGALEAAFAEIPRPARRRTLAAARLVLDRLRETGHERAADLLQELLG